MKTFHANMLTEYIEGATQQSSDDNQAMSCDICIEIIGGNEDLSVNEDEMMKLANCHQKETSWRLN